MLVLLNASSSDQYWMLLAVIYFEEGRRYRARDGAALFVFV
jgi:hypothetical protein